MWKLTSSLALAGAAILAVSTANAANLGSPGLFAGSSTGAGSLIQVHSRKQVHDTLHEFGYDNVVYQSQYRDDHGKPVYQFRACQGRRAFAIDVNWYGHIISQQPAGRCDRDTGHGYRGQRDSRDW